MHNDDDEIHVETLDCDHQYTPVFDEEGNPTLIGGWRTIGAMMCEDCGHEREIDAHDMAKLRDEAQYAEWEARR